MTITCHDSGWPEAGDGLCCYGAIFRGPGGCTCWEPVHVPRSAPLPPTDLVARDQRCVDCAFRPDSPERADGTLDRVLDQIEDHPGRPFFCHQGLTPIVEYRHPSGAVYRPQDLPSAAGLPPMDYQPRLNSAGRPCRDDGSQQDVCAGWVAEVRRSGREGLP